MQGPLCGSCHDDNPGSLRYFKATSDLRQIHIDTYLPAWVHRYIYVGLNGYHTWHTFFFTCHTHTVHTIYIAYHTLPAYHEYGYAQPPQHRNITRFTTDQGSGKRKNPAALVTKNLLIFSKMNREWLNDDDIMIMTMMITVYIWLWYIMIMIIDFPQFPCFLASRDGLPSNCHLAGFKALQV